MADKYYKSRLTTTDNPYNPFTEFDKWYDYDTNVLGYSSLCYLARIAHPSEELSDQENEEDNERAIDEIVLNDFLNIYKKVKIEVDEYGDPVSV